ncbi:uncharacterized protein [Magallana gigas]|uniref:uncharacterized protein n=1 Tax=Magallana gigas TaxID=29159 RepID=UPI00333EAFE8
MNAFYWMISLKCFTLLYCYENLCLRNSTILSLSSTHINNSASLANDGVVLTKEMYCAITDRGLDRAWLQVDLGKQFSIKSIKIYYRRENHWKQFRFRQFYLDISNSSVTKTKTLTSQRTRCYTDNTTYPYLPQNKIEIPCIQTARYVIVETTYDAPEDNPTRGAILEICEIEVYGCVVGHYDFDCRFCQGCQKNDFNGCYSKCINSMCDKNDRKCTYECIPGYWGDLCDLTCPLTCFELNCNISTGHCLKCPLGVWGAVCDQVCPTSCYGGDCDKENNTCTHGCLAGKFGDTCEHNCSSWCVEQTCEQHSGHCTDGCVQGWFGEQCDRPLLHHGCYSSNHQLPLVLNTIIVVLCLSLILNVLLTIRICWNCRRKKKKQGGQNQEVDDPSSTNDVSPHHVIYERVEENGGYLTYLSRSSIYDQLERN